MREDIHNRICSSGRVCTARAQIGAQMGSVPWPFQLVGTSSWFDVVQVEGHGQPGNGHRSLVK